MTTLRIRVDKDLAGRSLRLGAVVNIVPLSATTGPKSRPLRGVVVPVGDQWEARNVNVAPGRYLVQAALPSGERLTGYVDAAAGPSALDVVLASEDSPHEWFGLQHLRGAVPSRQHLEYRERQEALEPLELFAGAAVRFADAERRKVELVWFDSVRAEEAFRQWLMSDDAIDEMAVRHLVGGIIAGGALDPQLQGSRFRKFELPGRGSPSASMPIPPLLTRRLGASGDRGHSRRFVALLEDQEIHSIGALPHEWLYVNQAAPTGGQPVGMDVVIAPAKEMATAPSWRGHRLSINLSDPDVSAMLGFLAHGNLQAARAMLELASQWLYGKFLNPYAAAAGGYVLVRANGVADLSEPDWKSWLYNLAHAFPWLPDGQIQLASLMLESPEPETEAVASLGNAVPADAGHPFEEARDLSLRALAAGPPVFAFGVRMLLDNLTLLVNADRRAGTDNDRARLTRRASEVARWLSLRTERAQPFTVIRL